jgi:hypothetical protein
LIGGDDHFTGKWLDRHLVDGGRSYGDNDEVSLGGSGRSRRSSRMRPKLSHQVGK